MGYSIEDFWRPRLGATQPQKLAKGMHGWSAEHQRLDSYVQAALSLRNDSPDLDQPIWLIAAPGAVGKSTLAKEICSVTSAIYVDLASAETVAGNYLTGGLVKAGLFDAWKNGQTTLLVDALDEARLRVTQASFEDFLNDAATIAQGRKLPLILLGRAGIVEEAYRHLSERCGLSIPVFDIELFDLDQAKAFVWSALGRLGNASPSSTDELTYPHLKRAMTGHAPNYKEAIGKFVDHLAQETAQDDHQFVGYAPVLDAIATVIAAETNVTKVAGTVEAVLAGKVLAGVTQAITEREAIKVASQVATATGVSIDGLYGPKEQLERLASLLFANTQPVSLPPGLPAHAASAYEQAVESLLPQHPFLAGSNPPQPSSAVFGAYIVAASLRSCHQHLAKSAEAYVQSAAHAPNPFLFDFYSDEVELSSSNVPAAHIGLLYESLQAKTRGGELARLSATHGADDKTLDLEMVLISAEKAAVAKEPSFTVDLSGPLRLGRRISGVNIDAEMADVEIGDGSQLEMVAPINIRVRNLIFICEQVVVKPEPSQDALDHTVYLEAAEALTEISKGTPVVRHGAQLSVSWPGSNAYPWSNFTSDGKEHTDPRLAEAQRALRRLCISFRSHSKGQLARNVGKVEHFRMTKGDLGIALRKKLIDEGVLKVDGYMYILDPDALGQKVGLSFQDLKLKNYSPTTDAFLTKLLAESS